jgi:outer membrane receptor protein involved in Fe transport
VGILRYTLAAYLIDLEDFQFTFVTPSGFGLVTNGTTARSKGIELDTELRLSRDL